MLTLHSPATRTPAAGASTQASQTSASRDGDGFRIRGEKQFVLDGHVADSGALFAVQGEGHVFIVDDRLIFLAEIVSEAHVEG